MRTWLLTMLLCVGLLGSARAGEVGSTLGKYASAGAGVGALLGTAAATIPYLQSKEPYDFLTGAGIGLLGGSIAGFILGLVDVANPAPEQAAQAPQAPEGLFIAWTPQRATMAWSTSF